MNELDIVQGFIAASASFANHHAAARAFLEPKLQRTWQPGWAAAIVVGLTPKVSKEPARARERERRVRPAGHGYRDRAPGGHDQRRRAVPQLPGLDDVHVPGWPGSGNQWRITALPSPSSLLLLTQADFKEVYQPRNLYVWTPSTGHQALVPEPVFAPQEGTSATAASVAQNLIKALLANQAQHELAGVGHRIPVPARHQAARRRRRRRPDGHREPGRRRGQGQPGAVRADGRAAGGHADQQVLRPAPGGQVDHAGGEGPAPAHRRPVFRGPVTITPTWCRPLRRRPAAVLHQQAPAWSASSGPAPPRSPSRSR